MPSTYDTVLVPTYDGDMAEALTPAQQQVLAVLGANASDRPQFPTDLAQQLRDVIESTLVPIQNELSADNPMFLSKHDLAMIHACEARALFEKNADFEWTPAIAKGSVAHKAIELSMHWPGDTSPLELVDIAIERLRQTEKSLGLWLDSCSDLELAEVRALANERVVTFSECFPPLKKQWRPATEARLRTELLDGKIILSGRTDISLGKANGQTAGKVIIDLKTGRPSTTHLDDLRFYALIETLRLGVPPRRVASYYLDSALPQAEDVTVDVLFAAAHRTADGIIKIHQLTIGERAPTVKPSYGCTWCQLVDECAAGQQFLGTQQDENPFSSEEDSATATADTF